MNNDIEIKPSKNIPKRRNGYYYRQMGEKVIEYPSVTSILSVIAKPALVYWTGQQAARIALKNPELNEKEVMATLQLNLRESQDRGKEVHNILEEWAKTLKLPEISKYPFFLKSIKSFLETYPIKPIISELVVYSDKYHYAGRLDFIGELNSLNWLLDFKSGSGLYPEVSLQNISYKEAILENNLYRIDKTGAVLFQNDGTFTFKETIADIQDFLAVKKVWEWSKSKMLI